jgi:sec-independent protein translocase protein TatA
VEDFACFEPAYVRVPAPIFLKEVTAHGFSSDYSRGGFEMFEGLFRPMHLLVILFIVLIIFGPGKLPALGEGLGKSIRSFKKALTEKADGPEKPQ